MADIAKTLEKYKELLFDRAKYFKSEYETLPIPNLDISYFQKLNTADLMEYNPILGAIFIPYKHDIYILEQENVGKFFIKEAGKENKVMKRISALNPNESEISTIKLSKCLHMLAVIAGKEIKVYLVKNMFTEGKAVLVDTFVGEKSWRTLQWAPCKSETADDLILAIDEQQKLYTFNLKTKEKKSCGDQAITCATFSSDGDHIFAVTTKNEFIVFKAPSLEVKTLEKIKFIEDDEFYAKTVLSHIEEIKKDLWLFSGAVDDDDSSPIQCSKHTYMVQGDLANKNINDLPAQLFNEMFLHVFGVDQPKFEPPYYKHIYIPQRDVIVSGCTLAADVTAIINRNPKNPSNDIDKYEGFEMGVEQNIKLAAPGGVTGFFRGMVFYRNKFAQSDSFDYNENDEEKSMAYPPFIFVLTSTGQIGKYAFLLMRPEYQQESLLIKTEGLAGLKRNISVSSGVPPAKPTITQQQPGLSFMGSNAQPATTAAKPTISEVIPTNVPSPADEPWKETDIAKTLEKYKDLLFDRAKYFKSEYETLPIPNLDMKYFQKLNTADLMEHNPILGAIFIPYKQDIYILEQENVGKFFIKEAGKENKVMKCIKVLSPTDPEISMIKLSKCFNMLAVIAGKDIRVYLVKNMFTEGKTALVECFTGDKNWKTLQWAPRKSETSDDMLLAIDEENKLTLLNLKTKEGKRWSSHSISCATFSSDGDHIFAVTTKNEFIVFKSSNMQVVKIELIRFVEEDYFDITVFTKIQEVKKDLWLLSGAVDDDSSNPIQCTKHTFMIQGDILNKKINDLPAQLFNEMFLNVFGVDQPNFEPAYYKHLYIPQRDVVVSGCTLAADVTAIINRNPKNPSNDIDKYEGFEMGVEQNIKLAAPGGVTGFFRGMVFYNNKFASSDSFDYNENDEEKSMAYPPFIFVLTSTGQIGKYAFLLMRPEYQNDNLLIKTEGLAGLKRNIPVSAGIPPAKPTITQQPIQTTPAQGIFQAPTQKPNLLPQPTGPGTGTGLGLGIGIGSGSSLLNKQPLVNNQPTLQPTTKPTTGLGFDIKPALDTKPQQTSEGTFDPIAAKMNDTKANIMKKIDSLASYTDLINDVKKIFPQLSEKDKEFYQKEIQVQKTLHECQSFFKSLSLLLVEQEASRKKLESLIKSVDTESDAIRCIIGDEIIEGKEMNIYQNSELRQQVRKCEGQLKFFDEKLDYIEDFLDNYSTITEHRPTAAPEVIIGSPIKQLEERSNTIYHSFKNDDENSTSLYLTPMSSILRMSRSSKAPLVSSSKLQKPTQNTMNNISLTSSVMMNKSQAQRPATAALPQTNVSSKNSYVRPVPSLRATQLDSEYTRQLVQLNTKFTEALDHTQHKLTEIRRELQVLNRNIDRSAVKKQENTPAQKTSESTTKKQKRGIFFNPDSESDNEEELNKTVVQTQQGLFDQILGQSKAAKTTTIKIPLHKHKQGGYNGPQLSAILNNFDDLLSGKQALSSLPKVSVPQPVVQNKPAPVTAPTTTEKKPLIGGLTTQQQQQPQAPKVQAPSSVQQNTSIDGLKNKETGLLSFTTKPAQEEDKKTAPPQTSIFNKPLLQPKEETKTNEKPAAVGGGLFGNAPKTQVEEKKTETKPETKPVAGGLFAGGSMFGSKPQTQPPTTEKKEITDSSGIKAGPVPEDRKIKTLIKPPEAQPQKPLAPLKLRDTGEESGYKDEDEEGEKESASSGGDLTEEEKDQVTPPPMKKNDLKPIKSILGNLSDLDKMVTKSQPPGGKSGQKPLLESILNNNTADDDNIPAPVLVRDDSYIQPKALESPKIDFFKTMTGKPSFLQNKPEKPQESREDVAAKLKESLPKPGENITLFSKKVTKEESKEPEEVPKKPEPETQPKEIKAPEVSKPQQQEGSSLDALNKNFLDEALFSSPPTKNTEPTQPEPQAPAAQENKPAPQTVNTNLFNKPATTLPQTNQPPATNPTFSGLNVTKTSGPSLFTGASTANTSGTNMFASATSSQTQSQTGPFNFGQQSTPGANRFAIGGGNTQQPAAPVNPSGVGQTGFGARQLPSFGSTGQPTTNFGQHGGAMFGQHNAGFGQQQLQKPVMQTGQKVFGSQSKMFGSGTTGTAPSTGTGGGSTNFFGSAVSSNQSGSTGTSFFGNAMSQNTNAAPLNFLGGSSGGAGAGAGAGVNMMGSVRKTKQV